jgi:hypothetical protein
MVTERVVSVFAAARIEGGWVVQSPKHGCSRSLSSMSAFHEMTVDEDLFHALSRRVGKRVCYNFTFEACQEDPTYFIGDLLVVTRFASPGHVFVRVNRTASDYGSQIVDCVPLRLAPPS